MPNGHCYTYVPSKSYISTSYNSHYHFLPPMLSHRHEGVNQSYRKLALQQKPMTMWIKNRLCKIQDHEGIICREYSWNFKKGRDREGIVGGWWQKTNWKRWHRRQAPAPKLTRCADGFRHPYPAYCASAATESQSRTDCLCHRSLCVTHSNPLTHPPETWTIWTPKYLSVYTTNNSPQPLCLFV